VTLEVNGVTVLSLDIAGRELGLNATLDLDYPPPPTLSP
jgi:hypothetical protein